MLFSKVSSPGDKIVVEGVASLKDGAAIKLRSSTRDVACITQILQKYRIVKVSAVSSQRVCQLCRSFAARYLNRLLNIVVSPSLVPLFFHHSSS